MKRYEAEAPRWAEMYEGGMTVEQVALEVGVAASTVRSRLHKLNVTMRPTGSTKPQGNVAKANPTSKAHLDPAAAFVKHSVRRAYR